VWRNAHPITDGQIPAVGEFLDDHEVVGYVDIPPDLEPAPPQ
jgi:hypothetical protein